jgi:hypothetical protein
MAMPEWAYFMQNVYEYKKLGIDPKAQFQIPAELNNNPIYADQNFEAIVKKGQGSDYNQGNGDAGDYENDNQTNVPVESEFTKDKASDYNTNNGEKKNLNPSESAGDSKKDSLKAHPKKPEEKKPAINVKKETDY